MPATYEPIATTTLGSAASTITFSSIGSGYTDLRLIMVHNLATSDGFIDVNFNSDTGTNYSSTRIRANGSTVDSGRDTSATKIREINSFQNFLAMTEIDLFSYAGSTNKTVLLKTASDDNDVATNISIRYVVGLWRQTSAITSITLTGINSQIAAGTTATLYGILRA